jgi:hypothetical protein
MEIEGLANIVTTPEDKVRARVDRYAKRRRKKPKHPPKARSVRAVSGGLPGLGKRR